MNPQPATYQGNADFRGYLQANAPQYLNYVGAGTTGNDITSFGINNQALQQAGLDPTQTGSQIGQLFQTYNNARTSGALRAAGSVQPQTANAPIINIPGPYIPPVAPYIDTNAIAASAKSNATNQVNPLYNQYLNQYLQNEAADKTARQAETDTALKNLQAQLANTLAGTGLQREATTQNVAATEANVGRERSNYELQSGLQGEADRRNLLAQQGQAGLSASGLGAQQDVLAQQSRGAKEAAQEGAYTYTNQQQELFKNQTFAQLANSDQLSQLKEQEGENTENFNLADYLRQSANAEFQFQQQNEQQRQQAIAQTTADLYRQQFFNAIKPYSNNLPVYGAIMQAYNGGNL